MESNHQIIQVLKGLLVVCKASELGYLAAAEAMPGRTAREILLGCADQRRNFAKELETEIRFHSGRWFYVDPPVHSLTTDPQEFASRTKAVILKECERSEEALQRVYEDALTRKSPWDVYSVLAGHCEQIKETRHFLNALEQVNIQWAA